MDGGDDSRAFCTFEKEALGRLFCCTVSEIPLVASATGKQDM